MLRTLTNVKEIENYVNINLFYVSIEDDTEHRNSIFDAQISVMLSKYYFLNTLHSYIDSVNIDEVKVATLNPLPDDLDLSMSEDAFNDKTTGEIPDDEIISGQKELLENKVALLLSAFATIICNQKQQR